MNAQQQTLADELSDSLRVLPRRAPTGRHRKLMETDILKTKAALHNAKRFVLDDDLVKTITQISHDTMPDKMVGRFSSAVLPYPAVWLEFNFGEIFNIEFRGEDSTPEEKASTGRAGLLLVRSPTNPGAWTMEMVLGPSPTDPVDKNTVRAAPLLVQYGFSPYGVDALKAADVFRFKNVRTMTDEQRRLLSILVGSCWGFSIKKRNGEPLRPEFVDSTFLSISPTHTTRAANTTLTELIGIVNSQRTLSWGILRWAVTALSLLSEVPETVHIEEGGTHTTRQIGGKTGYSFHRLTLRLPLNKDPVRYINRKLDHAVAARKRAHDVRGHWRNYHLVDGCEHTWQQADEDPTYRRCTSCGGFSRFIAEHVRGDATLGWVKKEYVLAGVKA